MIDGLSESEIDIIKTTRDNLDDYAINYRQIKDRVYQDTIDSAAVDLISQVCKGNLASQVNSLVKYWNDRIND